MRSAARALRWIAWLATAVAAADVMIVLATNRTQTRLEPHPLPRAPHAQPAAAPDRHDQAALVDSITSRNLFKAAPSSESASVPDSPLGARYELTGTVVSKDVAASLAIVRERTASGNGASRTLHVGDALDARTKVESIEAPRLVLSGAGGREQLAFAWDEDAAVQARAAAPVDEPKAAEIERASDGSVTIGATTFDRYLSDPSPLFGQARIVGTGTDGHNAGFLFNAVQRGSVFEQLGLRSGDVVQKIDGQDLSSLDVALTQIQSLRSKHDFQATVRRGDSTQTLAFHVR